MNRSRTLPNSGPHHSWEFFRRRSVGNCGDPTEDKERATETDLLRLGYAQYTSMA